MKQRWSRLSIRRKAVVTQIALTLVSVFACTLLIVTQISAESRTDTASASYQYCRYIVQTLDTSVRQMESMANNIVGNKYVRAYVAMDEGAERNALGIPCVWWDNNYFDDDGDEYFGLYNRRTLTCNSPSVAEAILRVAAERPRA